MADSFAKTQHALVGDGHRRGLLVLALALTLLAAWVSWLLGASVKVYETTPAALEADQAVYPVVAPALGKVVRCNLILGREVREGAILVELEAEEERLELSETQSRLAGFRQQLAALDEEIAAEERAQVARARSDQARLEEAQARQREAQNGAGFVDGVAQRMAQLHAEGHVAEEELLRSRSQAEQQRQAAAASLHAADGLKWESRASNSDRAAEIARLRRLTAELQGEIAAHEATIARLTYEIDRRVVRAPADGKLGQVADLQVGRIVPEGFEIGTVVRRGTLRLVAHFAPSAALGHVRVGQPALARFDGFPWTQYGMLHATVARVGSDLRDGRVRVELAIHPTPELHVPLTHGLPATVDIEVENVSPATLVLRSAGLLLAGEPAAAAPVLRQAGVEGPLPVRE
jgi:multidrug resistance efflux pump